MDHFYTKKSNCINCEEEFATLRLRTRVAVPYQIDSDYCPHYREEIPNPLFYYVKVCPHCGFAFTDEYYGVYAQQTKKIIKDKITANWQKRDFGGVRDMQQALESLKLALVSATLTGETHAIQGGLALRLAWLYRTSECWTEEERFLTLALRGYENSYLYTDFNGTSMTEIKVLFLIGELSRRLGKFHQAIQYFSKITEHDQAHKEPKIASLARKQWKETAEEYREQKGKTDKEPL